MSAAHERIVAVAWQVGGRLGDYVGLGRIVIERMDQQAGPALYAVRNGRWVYNHRDEMWEVESMPSDRDDLFLSACRFADWSDAAHAAQEEAHSLARKVQERYDALASGADGGSA